MRPRILTPVLVAAVLSLAACGSSSGGGTSDQPATPSTAMVDKTTEAMTDSPTTAAAMKDSPTTEAAMKDSPTTEAAMKDSPTTEAMADSSTSAP